MADRISPDRRSANMARIRAKDTKPELAVRQLLHALGYRFRLHRRDLPGTPDVVFPSRRKIIDVRGCFWHQHEGCPRCRSPKSREGYWAPKLRRNFERDAEAARKRAASGWATLVIWECETARPDEVADRAVAFLGAPCGRSRS